MQGSFAYLSAELSWPTHYMLYHVHAHVAIFCKQVPTANYVYVFR